VTIEAARGVRRQCPHMPLCCVLKAAVPPYRRAIDWQAVARTFIREKAGSANTRRQYGPSLRLFLDSLAGSPSEATQDDVVAFAYRPCPSGQPPSGNTVAWRLALVSSFYRYAKCKNLLDHNPCDGIPRPQVVADFPP